MDVLLGVDGGNTKTLALLSTSDGTIVGIGRAGCADVHNAPSPESALAEIGSAVDSALRRGPGADATIVGAGFSLAGADWPEDFEFLQRRLAERLSAARLVVVNDAIGVLRCGSARTVGVGVAVGTYAAIASRNAAGDVFHRGWWPDSMGGEPIADAALSAVYRADLGLGPATALTERVCDVFGVGSVDALLYHLNRRGVRHDRPGALLTPVVLDEADAGDAVANDIVRQQAELIGAAARVSCERVGLGRGDSVLVLGGGVFRHPSSLLADGIARASGVSNVVRTASEPAVGALALAFDLLELDVDANDLSAGLGGFEKRAQGPTSSSSAPQSTDVH